MFKILVLLAFLSHLSHSFDDANFTAPVVEEEDIEAPAIDIFKRVTYAASIQDFNDFIARPERVKVLLIKDDPTLKVKTEDKEDEIHLPWYKAAYLWVKDQLNIHEHVAHTQSRQKKIENQLIGMDIKDTILCILNQSAAVDISQFEALTIPLLIVYEGEKVVLREVPTRASYERIKRIATGFRTEDEYEPHWSLAEAELYLNGTLHI